MKERGYLIRQLCLLVKVLNVNEALTVKHIVAETRLNIRQVYRWLHAMRDEGLVERIGRQMPYRFRLRRPSVKLIKRKEGGETTWQSFTKQDMGRGFTTGSFHS